MGIIPKEEEEEAEEESDDDSDGSDESDDDRPKQKRGLGANVEDSLALEKMSNAKRVDTSSIISRPGTDNSTASSLNPGIRTYPKPVPICCYPLS